jgi:mono/diheme cytochrome c family protein/ribosomal protein S27AE
LILSDRLERALQVLQEEKVKMKRYLGLRVGALTLIALALVAGCAKKPSTEEGTAGPPAVPAASAPAPTEKSAEEGTAMQGEEKFTYTCSMHPEVEQDQPGKCPKCGMFLEAKVAPGTQVEYYCPMHPEVVQDKPGECPKCGMFLVARSKTAEEKAGEAGTVQEEAHEHEHETVPAEYASLTNPLPDEEATRAAGKKLYQTKCLGCHGASGGGDGPQAAGRTPPPADFTDASMMAEMTDAALFWKISEGGQGTSMPAWKDRLKEDERWQLVRYLRTFSQAPPATSSGAAKSHPHHGEGEEHPGEGHGDH